jgi:hypothetical protein
VCNGDGSDTEVCHDDTDCKCLIDAATYNTKLGTDPTNEDNIGYIERDGEDGYTDESELVRIGTWIGANVTVHLTCNDCKCVKNGSSFELECQDSTCKDCEWNTWSDWSDCSVDCGTGIQTRDRTFTPGDPESKHCEGGCKEIQICHDDPCSVDGDWSAWNTWSNCSRTCGGGIQLRQRQCNNPEPAFGGYNCDGTPTEYQPCNDDRCTREECDSSEEITFFNYEDKITLTATIGPFNGKVKNAVENALADSSGIYKAAVETGTRADYKVNFIEEQTVTDLEFATMITSRLEVLMYGAGDILLYNKTITNLNTAVKAWTNFMDDSFDAVPGVTRIEMLFDECGDTYCIRMKELKITIAGGCTEILECASNKRYQNCTDYQTRSPAIACVGMGDEAVFVEPDTCRPSCQCEDGLTENDQGICVSPEECSCLKPDGNMVPFTYIGLPEPNSQDCQTCECLNGTYTCEDTEGCDRDCGWSPWSEWSGCSAVCGDGLEFRTRDAGFPTRLNGGQDCQGKVTESRQCNENVCQECYDPDNPDVAIPIGVPVKNDECTITYCDCTHTMVTLPKVDSRVDGAYDDWAEWSECNVDCGAGTRYRSRTCQHPKCGGDLCDGDTDQYEECIRPECTTPTTPFTAPECRENETYAFDATCEETCDEFTEDETCSGRDLITEECICKDNYYRNPEGECVEWNECNKCVDENGVVRSGQWYPNEDDTCFYHYCEGGQIKDVNGTLKCLQEFNYCLGGKMVEPTGDSCCACDTDNGFQTDDKCEQKSKTETLQVELSDGTICATEQPVNVSFCEGRCDSEQQGDIWLVEAEDETRNVLQSRVSVCKCCTGKGELKTFDVECNDAANTQRKIRVKHMTTCACNKCEEGEEEEGKEEYSNKTVSYETYSTDTRFYTIESSLHRGDKSNDQALAGSSSAYRPDDDVENPFWEISFHGKFIPSRLRMEYYNTDVLSVKLYNADGVLVSIDDGQSVVDAWETYDESISISYTSKIRIDFENQNRNSKLRKLIIEGQSVEIVSDLGFAGAAP